jgi:hypothetical protein
LMACFIIGYLIAKRRGKRREKASVHPHTVGHSSRVNPDGSIADADSDAEDAATAGAGWRAPSAAATPRAKSQAPPSLLAGLVTDEPNDQATSPQTSTRGNVRALLDARRQQSQAAPASSAPSLAGSNPTILAAARLSKPPNRAAPTLKLAPLPSKERSLPTMIGGIAVDGGGSDGDAAASGKPEGQAHGSPTRLDGGPPDRPAPVLRLKKQVMAMRAVAAMAPSGALPSAAQPEVQGAVAEAAQAAEAPTAAALGWGKVRTHVQASSALRTPPTRPPPMRRLTSRRISVPRSPQVTPVLEGPDGGGGVRLPPPHLEDADVLAEPSAQ